MSRVGAFFHALGAPFRIVGAVFVTLTNLTAAQIKSLFAVAMLAGIIALSGQNIAYTFIAESSVGKGPTYVGFFKLVQEQMRFNSLTIGFFALIMGLIVFGADFFRAKSGDKELEFGKKPAVPTPAKPFGSLDEVPPATEPPSGTTHNVDAPEGG